MNKHTAISGNRIVVSPLLSTPYSTMSQELQSHPKGDKCVLIHNPSVLFLYTEFPIHKAATSLWSHSSTNWEEWGDLHCFWACDSSYQSVLSLGQPCPPSPQQHPQPIYAKGDRLVPHDIAPANSMIPRVCSEWDFPRTPSQTAKREHGYIQGLNMPDPDFLKVPKGGILLVF